MDLLKYRLTWIFTCCLIAVVLVWLVSCNNHGQIPSEDNLQAISLSLRSVETTSKGNYKYAIRVTNAESLYQLAGRISFNPHAVRPVVAERGSLIDDRAAFFTLTNQPEHLPFAFTFHEGEQISSGTGSLLQLEFEQIDPNSSPEIELITDQDYLIARDAKGNSINLLLVDGE